MSRAGNRWSGTAGAAQSSGAWRDLGALGWAWPWWGIKPAQCMCREEHTQQDYRHGFSQIPSHVSPWLLPCSRGWEGPWSLPWKETRGVLLEKLFQRESIKLHGLGDSFCVLSCFCDRSKQNADTFRCCAVLIQLFKIPPPPPPHHMTGLGTKPVPINPCLELLLPL